MPSAMLTAAVTTVAMFFLLRALDAGGLIPSFARAPTVGLVAPVSSVEVPSLLGLRPEQARAALNAKELLLVLVGDRSSTLYGEGALTEQTPLGGSQAHRGATVQAFVSSGPRRIQLPALAGLTVAQATRQLAASDLVAAPPKSLASETIASGVVIQTEPVAGTTLPAQASVMLTVSSGPEARVVPKITGLRLVAARALLEPQGFKLGKVRIDANDDRAPGVILSQKPPPAAPAPPGTLIDITVNEE